MCSTLLHYVVHYICQSPREGRLEERMSPMSTMENIVRLYLRPTRRTPCTKPVSQSTNTKVIPMTPPDRLFIAGMAALSKAIIPLQTLCNKTSPDLRVRYEHILSCLLRVMPTTPRLATADTTKNISRLSEKGASEQAFTQLSRSPQDKALHLRWKRVWRDLIDPGERTFAQTCAIALTEALHVHARLERETRCI